MQSLLDKGAAQVRESSGRRLLPAHLKRVVEADPLFDFLNDIVKNIPDIEPSSEKSERAVKRRRESSGEPSPSRRRTAAASSSSASSADKAPKLSLSSPLPPASTSLADVKAEVKSEAKSEPDDVKSEPAEVKSEASEAKSEASEVKSEPAEVKSEPTEADSKPLVIAPVAVETMSLKLSEAADDDYDM